MSEYNVYSFVLSSSEVFVVRVEVILCDIGPFPPSPCVFYWILVGKGNYVLNYQRKLSTEYATSPLSFNFLNKSRKTHSMRLVNRRYFGEGGGGEGEG